MRILNVVGAFPPAFAEGGPGVMTYNVSHSLIELGHQVNVITTNKCGNDHLDVPLDDTKWKGVPVRYCNWKPSYLPYHSPELTIQVRKRLPKTDLLLLSSSWTSYGVSTGVECRRAGVPYILYAHGSYDPIRLRIGWIKKKIWWNLFDRKLYDRAAAIIALTETEAKQIRDMGVQTPIECIPIGVDEEQLSVRFSREELNSQYPLLNERPFVLFLGRLHPIKGVDILVKSFKEVIESVPEAVLVIAGPSEQSYENEIQALIKSLKLQESVLLTGGVFGQVKATFLKEATVYCLTSKGEGLPASALEAMYSGTPVVLSKACNLPGVREVEAGFVTDLNIDDIVTSIVSLLKNSELQRKMGVNGQLFIEKNYAWAKVAKKTAELCKKTVE